MEVPNDILSMQVESPEQLGEYVRRVLEVFAPGKVCWSTTFHHLSAARLGCMYQ